MNPSRPLLLIFIVVLLAAAPAAEAAQGNGRLAFGDIPVLDGALSGTGTGEIHTADPDAVVTGHAAKVRVLKVWYEERVLLNPLGGAMRTTTGDVQTEWRNFSTAGFTLDETKEGFRLLAFTAADEAEGAIVLPSTTVRDVGLAAFARPVLVADDKGRAAETRDEQRVFTYAADGDRFPVEAERVEASGTFRVFVGPADFTVTGAKGDSASFSSGVERTETSPSSYTEEHVYHLVTFDTGALVVDAADATGWFAAPTLSFDGTLTARRASGSMYMDGEAYRLDGGPVKVGGLLVFEPRPSGEPEPVEEDDSFHVGTTTPSGGRYASTESDVSGDVTVLAIGTEIPYMEQSDLTILAGVGVLTLVGTALAITPKGKWVILTALAPLYAKTERDRLLDNESRDRIFQAIRANPGINLSQIHRMAELGWGVTVYHLKMMEKNGLVFAESGPRDKCFFENDPKFRSLRSAIAAIANKEPAQKIAQVVASRPDLTQRELVAMSGLTQRAVSYYVGRMTRQGLLESHRDGNFVRYRPGQGLLDALPFVVADAARIPVTAPQGELVHA